MMDVCLCCAYALRYRPLSRSLQSFVVSQLHASGARERATRTSPSATKTSKDVFYQLSRNRSILEQNSKDQNCWVLCKKYTWPDKFYFFNSIMGEIFQQQDRSRSYSIHGEWLLQYPLHISWKLVDPKIELSLPASNSYDEKSIEKKKKENKIPNQWFEYKRPFSSYIVPIYSFWLWYDLRINVTSRLIPSSHPVPLCYVASSPLTYDKSITEMIKVKILIYVDVFARLRLVREGSFQVLNKITISKSFHSMWRDWKMWSSTPTCLFFFFL